MSESLYACEACRKQLNPSDADVVYAVELLDAGTFGSENEVDEGLGVFFHGLHFSPAIPGYRAKDKPERFTLPDE